VLFPYLMGVANALAAMRPRVTFQIIVSEFLSPELVTATRVKASRRWPALRPAWVTQDAWMALARSDLALTFPGTTTVELAMLGVPFAAIVPLEYLDRVPAEGILEWVGRIPAAGRMIKRVAAWWYFTRPRLTALPNLRAGRAIAPEWIGRWTPTELANRVSDLLDDEARRRTMKTELRSVYAASVGASARIAQQALALAAVPGASYP
jgi:lipid A disaccharide synthetase